MSNHERASLNKTIEMAYNIVLRQDEQERLKLNKKHATRFPPIVMTCKTNRTANHRGNQVIKKLTTTLLSAVLVVFAGSTGEAYASDQYSAPNSSAPELILSDQLVNKRKQAPASSIYIVQLEGDPVIAYEGGIKGYAATKPGKGKKLNPNSAHVKKYAAYLEAQQDQTMQSVGAEKVYSYRYGLNGFAARMSSTEAEALRQRGDVLNVWKDEIRQLHTNTSPAYIGLTEGGEAWSNGLTGEDVVIGIIDSGV